MHTNILKYHLAHFAWENCFQNCTDYPEAPNSNTVRSDENFSNLHTTHMTYILITILHTHK